MKNTYEAPEMEIRYFESEDVCAVITSEFDHIPGDGVNDGFGNL